MRRDLEQATASRERIRQRWALVDTPGDLEFVRYRNLIPKLPEVRTTLETQCSEGHHGVLLDDGDWFDTELTAGLAVEPFPDVGGHFGGFPDSEEAAREQLELALARGATAVVVGWPARWWFEHLPELRPTLSEWATSIRTDGLVEIFAREPAAVT